MEDWYRDLILKTRVIPPGESWEEIESQLDLDEVWQNVENTLHQDDRGKIRRRILYYSGAAAAVILLLAGWYLTDRLRQPGEKNILVIGDNVPTEIQAVPPTPDLPGDYTIDTESYPPSSGMYEPPETLPEVPAGLSGVHVPVPAVAGMENTTMETYHTLLGTSRIITPEYGSRLHIPRPVTRENLFALNENNRSRSHTYIGIHSSIKNTLLLNQTTYNSLNSSNLTATVPNISNSLYFTLGKDFSERLGLRLEGSYSDQGGHKYQQYIHGQYLNRQIQLDYLKLNLLVIIHNRKKHSSRSSGPTLLAGTYFGHLNRARERIHTELSNISSQYRNNDLGLTLGYEHDFPLLNRFIISPGIRTDIGIINIYDGTKDIPSHFNRTNNAAVSVSLGFKFPVSKR